MGSVKVGPKGQIVIPQRSERYVWNSTWDALSLFADAQQGIAIQRYELYEDLFNQTFNGDTKFKKWFERKSESAQADFSLLLFATTNEWVYK